MRVTAAPRRPVRVRFGVGGFEVEAELLEAPSQVRLRRVALRDIGRATALCSASTSGKAFKTYEGGSWTPEERQAWVRWNDRGHDLYRGLCEVRRVGIAQDMAESEGMEYVEVDDRSVAIGQVQEMIGGMAERFLFD
jgi:hypothetical protein